MCLLGAMADLNPKTQILYSKTRRDFPRFLLRRPVLNLARSILHRHEDSVSRFDTRAEGAFLEHMIHTAKRL